MPGPPPPPPPPMTMGGPPPPPPPAMGPPMSNLGIGKAPPDRSNLLADIADPSKPRLRKVNPNEIKDRSKPIVGGSSSSNNTSSQMNGGSNGHNGASADTKSKFLFWFILFVFKDKYLI